MPEWNASSMSGKTDNRSAAERQRDLDRFERGADAIYNAGRVVNGIVGSLFLLALIWIAGVLLGVW